MGGGDGPATPICRQRALSNESVAPCRPFTRSVEAPRVGLYPGRSHAPHINRIFRVLVKT